MRLGEGRTSHCLLTSPTASTQQGSMLLCIVSPIPSAADSSRCSLSSRGYRCRTTATPRTIPLPRPPVAAVQCHTTFSSTSGRRKHQGCWASEGPGTNFTMFFNPWPGPGETARERGPGRGRSCPSDHIANPTCEESSVSMISWFMVVSL
jgi:hypothetical protein